MTSLDPFSFEILRHRLWTINVEGALALQRVSGSPLATEAFDMNTSIMTAAGEVVFVGPYLLTGPMGQGLIVRRILAGSGDGTGLSPGDVFLCNDPYSGSAHQNCVTLVAPIHADDALVAWAGATLHVVDVGGPTAGQVGIGARSILDEAPVTPPVRIVRAGRIDPRVEADYLGRSRTPELNALDLRAKLAAVNTIADRVRALIHSHGRATVEAMLAETVDRATAHFRSRLAEVPDGVVRKTSFVDHGADDDVDHLAVDLRLEKRGDRLVLDFRGSSPQAPAIVNCTRSGLLSGVLIGILTTLVWDAPWCPAAIERSVEVLSSEGSVVDARWPAGCSMATMAAGFASTTATAVAVGELLSRSVRLRDRAMAAWAGAVGSVDVFGADG
ncbi:MAG TPA: hydantoinase B/oxoprolinase family protein, partial [Candidatus Limnocylindrales bacterium]|nr:hydantoinase B/oxoprolinase family protein [Candidatus Limnocylindrales bacterium]